MPLYAYCPQQGCGAKIPYEITKPTSCPRCRKTFASAFTVKPVPPPMAPMGPTTTDHVDDQPEDRPLTKSALLRARQQSTTKVKPRLGRREMDSEAHLMNQPPEPAPAHPEDGLDEGDDLDPREVRRKARELAATIDQSSILIEEDAKSEQRIFSFADYWAAGESARKNTVVKQPAKTRRRR